MNKKIIGILKQDPLDKKLVCATVMHSSQPTLAPPQYGERLLSLPLPHQKYTKQFCIILLTCS